VPRKFWILLKYVRNEGYFIWRHVHIYMMKRAHLYDDTCTFIWWHVHIYMMKRAHLYDDTCTFIWWNVHIYMMTRAHLCDETCTFIWWNVHIYMMTRAHLYDDTCTFIWWHVHIYMMTRAHLLITCSRILLTKGNVSDKSRREILCSVTFSEYCTVYETVWKNVVDCVWNVMSHAQKPDFVFRRNGQVHLNRRGRQISRLLAAEVCASAVVMLDAPCS